MIAFHFSNCFQWILPLLCVLLRRHLDIIRITVYDPAPAAYGRQKRPTHFLHSKEVSNHLDTLESIFDAFDRRARDLAGK